MRISPRVIMVSGGPRRAPSLLFLEMNFPVSYTGLEVVTSAPVSLLWGHY
ncbi:rCG25360 [Rattus norvegicus]|uniref:RCG25360 n=1 Tax=Rattus norvegicus TaxID=10116 RepID=A6I2J9_RAT|nr:rCG25360 [Rattus norvegicus]